MSFCCFPVTIGNAEQDEMYFTYSFTDTDTSNVKGITVNTESTSGTTSWDTTKAHYTYYKELVPVDKEGKTEEERALQTKINRLDSKVDSLVKANDGLADLRKSEQKSRNRAEIAFFVMLAAFVISLAFNIF